jgi:WD repeat-containing protein 35
MGEYHFAAVSHRTVYTWQFSSDGSRRSVSALDDKGEEAGGYDGVYENNSNELNSSSKASASPSASRGRERMFDVESTNFSSAQPPETFRMVGESIKDIVTAVALSDRFLVVGRKTGTITRYVLPHLSPENTYKVAAEPYNIALNCTSSKLSVIDKNGVFSVIDLEARSSATTDSVAEGKDESPAGVGTYFGKKLNVERRDVWDVKWAEDNEEMVAVMEKTKLVIFRGETAEEPVVSSGYLARFRDLEVRAVLLDELTAHPDPPNKACVVDHESRLLREAREEIISTGTSGGYAYIEKNPHPRLWRLLANKSLEDLDLSTAERAFVHCKDYHGIQLIKQLKTMPDKMKARAEVAVYMGKYDEAESIYREIDRKDLAIKFRKRIGDHMRVVQLLQTGGGNDKLIKSAWDRIGQYFTDRFKWRKAVQYFQLSRNVDKLAECYYRLENFVELAKLRHEIADGTPLLSNLAKQFECVGMYDEAVDCFVRSGDTKAAVDCCVKLNRWDTAIELAERYDYPQVEGLLTKYAIGLTTKGRHLEAVELYRRANRPTEAALLIGEIADKAANEDVRPTLAKKLHVLAALEIERHRKKTMDLATQATLNAGPGGGTAAQTTMATLETLMMTTLDTQGGGGGTTQTGNKKASKAFGNAWRGAAAYHYYMLAHRQLYDGKIDAAMKTSIKLCEYDDILEPRDIFSLLCVTSFKNKFFGICSKAFVKLETLDVMDTKDFDDIQTLAVKIFVNNTPTDPSPLPEPYMKCLELGKTFKACTVSGRAILDSESITCKRCRHPLLEHERGPDRTTCPLCHHQALD